MTNKLDFLHLPAAVINQYRASITIKNTPKNQTNSTFPSAKILTELLAAVVANVNEILWCVCVCVCVCV